MKRLVITLSIIAILGMFSPGFSILAQPTQVPHQNPTTAKGALDTAALLLSYGNVFNLATTRQYKDAQDILSALKQADLPDELRYIIDRYSTLSQQWLTMLNNLDFLLDEASTLLSRHQINDAKQRLDEAETAIHDSQFLLEDIAAATDTLNDELGVSAASATSYIKQTHDRLEESLRRLRELINEFNQLRQSLTERYKAQAIKLIPTELSLSTTPVSVFVGDNVTVSGILSSGGNPLPQRELAILFDDKPLSLTTTDSSGSYETTLTIPSKYDTTLTIPSKYVKYVPATLTADYVPSGDDIGTYQGRKSQPVSVMFYTTYLEVSAPETAHPGMPFTIDGHVSSTDGDVDRTIKIFVDDIQLTEETVRGQFNLEVTLPQQTLTGAHSLTVLAAPQGRYSGASKSLTANVSKLSIQTDTQVPQLIIIPKPIQISGKVFHELGPVPDARISLNFKNSSSTVRTLTDGSFATSLDVPLDLFLFGPQKLLITIEMAEPWPATLEVERQIFTINPANIGLMLIAFLSLGLLVYKRGRTRPREEKVTPPPEVRELLDAIPTPEPKPKFTGIKGRILSAHTSGREAIEKTTNLTAAPHTTLRELLKTATPLVPIAIKPFAELTTMAEVALYSAHRLDEAIATRAEQLAATIKEELHSGIT